MSNMLKDLREGLKRAEDAITDAELAIKVLKGAGENVTAQTADLKRAKSRLKKFSDSLKRAERE